MTAQPLEIPVETLELEGRPYFVAIEPLLSVAEAAEYSRVSTATIYRAHEAGLLVGGRPSTDRSNKATSKSKQRIVFRRADLDAWLFPPADAAPTPPRRRTVAAVAEPTPVDPRSRKPRPRS